MALSERAKEARRAYQRAWAHRNKDKIKRYKEAHWEKVAREQEQFAKSVEGVEYVKEYDSKEKRFKDKR